MSAGMMLAVGVLILYAVSTGVFTGWGWLFVIIIGKILSILGGTILILLVKDHKAYNAYAAGTDRE